MDDKIAAHLAQEYLFLQKVIEDFDARALTIKAWSVTFSAVALGLAYQLNKPPLLLVAAASAMAFWIVEGVWKYHQHGFYPRIFAIEDWFLEHAPAGEAKAPFQISTQWFNAMPNRSKRREEFKYSSASGWKVFGYLGVMMPHVIILGAGILLFALAQFLPQEI